MSRKQIYGITLTSEERRMAGYDGTSVPRHTPKTAPAASPPHHEVLSHACTVTLPDGTTCQAVYTRLGYGGHAFQFRAPVCEQVYRPGSVPGDTDAIEARAQDLVRQAWRQAQAAEQKTMRLASAPSHLVHSLDSEPQLQRKTAQRFAGLYAVCLRYKSGTLTPLSSPCERPADALSDLRRMQEEGNPNRVIGICCRWARRWQPARFLADGEAEGEEQQGMNDGSGCEVEHADDEASADEQYEELEE